MAETGRRRAARPPVNGLALVVTYAGIVAALLMVLADFLPIVSVDVAGGSCEVINDTNPELAKGCEQSGFERHGPALVLLAPVAAAMAWGAGGARPAAAALLAVGVVVLAIALLIDLPATDGTGAIGPASRAPRPRQRPGSRWS